MNRILHIIFVLYIKLNKIQINMEEDYNIRYGRRNENWPKLDNQNSQQHALDQQNNHDTIQQRSSIDFAKAKQKFKQFSEEIGELKRTCLREDVLQYNQNNNKKQKTFEIHYKPQTILKKIEIRIQKQALCQDRMIKTKKIKRNWGQQDIKILLWVISKYCDWKKYQNIENQLVKNFLQKNSQDWNFIASLIPGATSNTCMFKWLGLKKITLSMKEWSHEQSQLLSRIVKSKNYSSSKRQSDNYDWKKISQQLYLQNPNQDKVFRNAKQCRQHWTCYLCPQLKKGPWQLHEDVRLLKFIKHNQGLKKWSEISKFFQGRTENALKNRYTLIIEKQKKQMRNRGKSELDLVSEYLQRCFIDLYTSQKNQDEHMQAQQKKQTDPNNQQKSLFQPIVVNKQTTKIEVIQQLLEHQDNFQTKKKITKEKYQFNLSSDSINSSSTQTASSSTPLKVEVFNFKDFDKIKMESFFKHVQPGVIDAAGKFKKFDCYSNTQEWKSPSYLKTISKNSNP